MVHDALGFAMLVGTSPPCMARENRSGSRRVGTRQLTHKRLSMLARANLNLHDAF